MKQHHETVKKKCDKNQMSPLILSLWDQFQKTLKTHSMLQSFPQHFLFYCNGLTIRQMKPTPPIPAQVNPTLQMFDTVTSLHLNWWWKKNQQSSADTCVYTYTHSPKHMFFLWRGGQGGQPLIARCGCIIAWLKAVLQTHCAVWGRRGWLRARRG